MEPVSDRSSFYFTNEQIKNFKIRACLQQLTGTQLVDVSPRIVEGTVTVGGEFSLSSFIPLSTFSSSNSNSANKQQLLISWQQKILSASEIAEYSRLIYAENQKYREWHEQAVKLKKRRNWRKRIFTYIHEDDYQSRIHQPATSSEGLEPEVLLRRRNITNTRRKSSDSVEEGDGQQLTTRGKRNKTKDAKNKQSSSYSSGEQHFYVMADLAPPESLGETRAYEVILCALRFCVNGLLIVTPDFNKPNSKPYRLESFGSDNALYEYTITHASYVRSAEDKKKEDHLMNQIYHQRLEEIQQKVGSNWDDEQLKSGMIRLVVSGEITRAHHFEVDNLYIHYLLHLPPGWKVNKNCTCEGFTPVCSVRQREGVSLVHYSTPIAIDITCSKTACQDWPVLLLGAFSVDWWDRDRDEGYAAFPLPVVPAQRNNNEDENGDREDVHSVHTWRPAQTSPFSQMRRFFLGGCQLLTDSLYLVVGANAKNGQASRLGFSTVSSGVIELRANAMIQTGDVHTDSSSSKGLHSTTWQLSTHAVLDAFQRSRQKLRAAKHGLI